MGVMVPASMLFGKGKGKGKGKDAAKKKTMDKIGKVESDLKVWVGNLAKSVDWKVLSKHFEELGFKPHMVEVMKGGKGVCTFKTAEEASSAIAAAQGSELKGKAFEVDVWEKKEKKEKKA